MEKISENKQFSPFFVLKSTTALPIYYKRKDGHPKYMSYICDLKYNSIKNRWIKRKH